MMETQDQPQKEGDETLVKSRVQLILQADDITYFKSDRTDGESHLTLYGYGDTPEWAANNALDKLEEMKRQVIASCRRMGIHV